MFPNKGLEDLKLGVETALGPAELCDSKTALSWFKRPGRGRVRSGEDGSLAITTVKND
jgi:hypothetical protein